MYRFILLGMFVFLLPLYTAFSETKPKENRIINLKVSTETSKEKIEILFTSPFKESVSFLFVPGFLKVIFPHTQFKSELAHHICKRINDIKSVSSHNLPLDSQSTSATTLLE